jgi:hypothetical protein
VIFTFDFGIITGLAIANWRSFGPVARFALFFFFFLDRGALRVEKIPIRFLKGFPVFIPD